MYSGRSSFGTAPVGAGTGGGGGSLLLPRPEAHGGRAAGRVVLAGSKDLGAALAAGAEAFPAAPEAGGSPGAAVLAASEAAAGAEDFPAVPGAAASRAGAVSAAGEAAALAGGNGGRVNKMVRENRDGTYKCCPDFAAKGKKVKGCLLRGCQEY